MPRTPEEIQEGKSTEVRVLSYNQMYAGRGRKLSGTFGIHFWHNLGRPDKMHELGDVARTIDLVRATNPDVLGLTELLGTRHENEIGAELKKLGYTYRHTGHGHGWPNSDQRVTAMIATKMESHSIPIEDITFSTKPGAGGGMVHAYVTQINTNLLLVHLATKMGELRSKVFDEQIKIIHNIITETHEKRQRLLIFGDFNLEYEEAAKAICVDGINIERYSPDEPTCNVTNILQKIYYKCIDHILGTGFISTSKRTILWKSDHKAVESVLTLSFPIFPPSTNF